MNLPENVSAAATSLYQTLSASSAPQSASQLAQAAQQPSGSGEPKATATANSLVIKSIIQKAPNGEGEATYELVKSSSEIGPDQEADANEQYVQKADANAEEQRMIDLLEKNGNKLPEAKLFELYENEQTPDGPSTDTANNDIEAALQELLAAGAITSEGDTYRIKQ